MQRHIYYFAGGGWQQPPSSQHWKFCSELCRALGPDTVVSVVSLPLAPQSPAAKTMPILVRFHHAILVAAETDHTKVILAGDSSGGNIILGMTFAALQERDAAYNNNKLAPAALLAISPAVDARPMSDEGSYHGTNRFDPVLTIDSHNEEAATWAQDSDPALPWISPINGEMDLLKKRNIKVIGVTGGYDILTPDALAFKRKCEDAGVEGEWLHWEQQMHCFPLAFMYGLSESVRSKDWIVEQLKKI